jgi:LPXTG-site transpeptidase (sortase) family protein
VTKARSSLVVFWASLAVIVAVVLYLGVLQWQAGQEATVESVGSRPAYSPTASPSPSPTPTGPLLVAAPMRLRIPAMDVNTKVLPVGLDKNKAIEIPEDIRLVGWYELGVPPGVDRGSAVLVAHRDGREQGRGVFYDLGSLDVGDKVYVETSAGEELPYKVVSRESILKKRLPYEELFAVDGDPLLTLISCGGYYDPNNGGYQDNVVVTAVPMFTPISTEPSATASPSASPSPSVAASASPSVSPSSSSAATSASEPVSVVAPQAATIAETSMPVLFNGSILK